MWKRKALTLEVIAEPAVVKQGTRVLVTARPRGKRWFVPLWFYFNCAGARVATDPRSRHAFIDTGGLVPGLYTVTAHAADDMPVFRTAEAQVVFEVKPLPRYQRGAAAAAWARVTGANNVRPA